MSSEPISEVMKAFWDEKARENALYYISSFRAYDNQDPEEFWAWGKRLTDKFLEESEIAFTGNEAVLEIGCGIGRMTRYLAERFERVVGVDVSPEMIRCARENLGTLKNVELRAGTGCDLSGCDDASFQFVFSYLTFQHIPDVKIVMNYVREAGRVLEKGGHFYFQVNNLPENFRSRLKLRGRVRAALKRLPGRTHGEQSVGGPRGLDNPAWRGSRVSLRQLERACEQGGLRILKLNGEGTQYLWVKAVKV